MKIYSGPRAYFNGEDDLNSEDAGRKGTNTGRTDGTDVVSTSSTQLENAVYGVVELLLDRDRPQWTFRSLCSPLTPHGVEGRWQWPSLVAILGTAQHVQPAALTA